MKMLPLIALLFSLLQAAHAQEGIATSEIYEEPIQVGDQPLTCPFKVAGTDAADLEPVHEADGASWGDESISH